MAKNTSLKVGLTAALLMASVLAACDDPKRETKAPIDSKDIVTVKVYPALRGTVGEYAVLLDASPLPVEGYGLVVNLPGTGSGDMTPEVRSILSEQLYDAGAGSYTKGTEKINPARILSSRQVAATEVHGMIPPFARKGEKFDLWVTTVASSEATSIENGLLWSSQLKVIGLRTDIDSSVIAMGRGPVYMPERVKSSLATTTQPAATTKSLRSGMVMGGGVVTTSRDVRLQLLSPSFRLTGAIERAVNSRFQGYDKTADAQNDTLVALDVPPEYSNAPMAFVEVVQHMYLAQDVPGFTEKKAAELVKALEDPAAPHRKISLALQGLGRSILPQYIQPLYTSTNPTVRFWGGRAGAAMNDVGGLVVLEEAAGDPKSPFRDQAISSIIDVSRGTDTVRATLTLMKLLNTSTDTPTRLAAYGGLIAIRSSVVRTYSVSKKFMLDLVPSDGPPMIYVTQTGTPRVALIGHGFTLPPGSLYVSDDNLLTVNVAESAPSASAGVSGDGTVLTAAAAPAGNEGGIKLKKESPDENVVLYWRGTTGDQGLQLTTTSTLPELVARLAWEPDPLSSTYDPKAPFIGASYQRIVQMLGAMCRDRTLAATFVEQRSPDLAAAAKGLAATGRSEGSTTQPVKAKTDPSLKAVWIPDASH